MGTAIDAELVKSTIDVDTVKALVRERQNLVVAAEDEFIDEWVSMRAELSDEQYEQLVGAYRREFHRLPHPVLGTSAYEEPLGTKSMVGAS